MEDLFNALELPFSGLLDSAVSLLASLSRELLDLFWQRLGQSLIGVPGSVYQLNDMLESILPERPAGASTLRPSNAEGTNKVTPGSANGLKSKRPTNDLRLRPARTKTPQSDASSGQMQAPKANTSRTKSAQLPGSE